MNDFIQAMLGGGWRDIPLLKEDPDALVINLGDLLQFWTGGLWHSPLHRVLKKVSVNCFKIDQFENRYFLGKK